jgi:hypothetical protein
VRGRYRDLLEAHPSKPSRRAATRTLLLVSLFSSSLVTGCKPLSRFLSPPLFFVLRSLLNLYSRLLPPLSRLLPTSRLPPSLVLPTLQPRRAWACKQAGIFAGALLLSLASQGVASCAMEGYK